VPTDTKIALLNSAKRAARMRGFDGFSYTDLAHDVSIRKASIHHHFTPKAALPVALMERYHATFSDICGALDAKCTPGGERLTAMIDQYRYALKDGKSLCLCVSFSTSRDSLLPEVVKQISKFRQMVIGWLAAAFSLGRQDGSISTVGIPDKEAAAMLALLEGAQLAARAEDNPARFQMALQLLVLRLS
jgi:TetR/AcrR family transcriptional repressor of nem operon